MFRGIDSIGEQQRMYARLQCCHILYVSLWWSLCFLLSAAAVVTCLSYVNAIMSVSAMASCTFILQCAWTSEVASLTSRTEYTRTAWKWKANAYLDGFYRCKASMSDAAQKGVLSFKQSATSGFLESLHFPSLYWIRGALRATELSSTGCTSMTLSGSRLR